VGHLIQIMLLRRLQQAGHRPIVLMGGGTTKVGRPRASRTQRPLLTDETIAANIAGHHDACSSVPDVRRRARPTRSCSTTTNGCRSSGYIEFLREYGTHFTSTAC
jgi:tyrosyl-tRNA synthetase